jgi:enoyl-CoA hydratase/carnithine racemase
MNSDLVIFERTGSVAIVRLHRESKLNALNRAIFDALTIYLDDIARDESCSVAILTGTGHLFCAGADIGEYWQGNMSAFREFQNRGRRLNDLPPLLIFLSNTRMCVFNGRHARWLHSANSQLNNLPRIMICWCLITHLWVPPREAGVSCHLTSTCRRRSSKNNFSKASDQATAAISTVDISGR